jgi:hypothetical protein
MADTPKAISRAALMDALRELGIDPRRAQSVTITYDGVDIENFVFGESGQKIVTMHRNGDLEPVIETEHIPFVR